MAIIRSQDGFITKDFEVCVQAVVRFDQGPNGLVPRPCEVNLSLQEGEDWTVSSLTPSQARHVAKILYAAAEVAEAENA